MILFQNFQGFTLFSYQGSLAPVCPTGQLKHIITITKACQQQILSLTEKEGFEPSRRY